MSGMQITAVHLDGCRVLEIREQFEEPGHAVVAVHGELDHHTEDTLERTLARTWEQWPDEVTVDLQGTTFINARGLACLLRASKTARVRRLPLRLRCHPGLVARMLVLVGLGELMWTPSPPGTRVSIPAVLSFVSSDGPPPPRDIPLRARADCPGAKAVRAPHPVAFRSASPAAVGPPTQVAAVRSAHPALAGMAALIALDRFVAAAAADREAIVQVMLSQLRASVPGAEHSSFTHGYVHRLLAQTSSASPSSVTLAALQQHAHQGPARDSQRLQEQVYSPDLRCDIRWPQLAAMASAQAVRSLLSLPVVDEGHQLGVLTLHSDQPHAFDTASRDLAGAMVARAGTSLGDAHVRDGLQKALSNRDLIGQGRGILMARHELTAQQAHELMSHRSQHTNTRLVDVAEELARTGDL